MYGPRLGEVQGPLSEISNIPLVVSRSAVSFSVFLPVSHYVFVCLSVCLSVLVVDRTRLIMEMLLIFAVTRSDVCVFHSIITC